MSVTRVDKITGLGNTGPVFSNGMTFPAGTFGNLADKIDINTIGVATFANLNATTVSVANSVTAATYTGNGYSLTGLTGLQGSEALGLIQVIS